MYTKLYGKAISEQGERPLNTILADREWEKTDVPIEIKQDDESARTTKLYTFYASFHKDVLKAYEVMQLAGREAVILSLTGPNKKAVERAESKLVKLLEQGEFQQIPIEGDSRNNRKLSKYGQAYKYLKNGESKR